MSRAAVFGLYTALVVIWSSTWVAIKIGLEDCPPLLGAGIRFAFAGLVLLAVTAVRRRSLRTDALGGLALAFAESLELGSEQYAALGAVAVVLSPWGSAVGNVSIRRRAARLDAVVLNGWAMLGGGIVLLVVAAATEDWGDAAWTAKAIGSIAYLALVGSAVAFVGLTVLLRHVTAQASSFIAMLIPFGALVFGALVYDEPITARALVGAGLVAAGLLVAQGRRRTPERREPVAAAGG